MTRVGILGGGQLSVMQAEALQRLGATVSIYDPDPLAPARQRLPAVVTAPWEDREALVRFVAGQDVVTFDTEHVPVAALAGSPAAARLRPGAEVVAIAQDRVREKRFLAAARLPHVRALAVDSLADLMAAGRAFGLPCLVKRARGGYDGRGQARLRSAAALAAFLAAEAAEGYAGGWVLEEPVRLTAEISAIVARRGAGDAVLFPLLENVHRRHVLDLTIVPARLPERLAAQARAVALRAAEALDVVGLLTVEFFIGSTPSRPGRPRLLVNELAPRPHNSGHVTRRACSLSQFDALARVLLDLPLPPPRMVGGGHYCMANLLGDCWPAAATGGLAAAGAPAELLELYGYGKAAAAPGRKMGHVITEAASAERARRAAETVRRRLRAAAGGGETARRCA